MAFDPKTDTLHILVRRRHDERANKDGCSFTAECVEFDMVAVATERYDVAYEIEAMILAHIASFAEIGISAWDVRPAPVRVRAEFEALAGAVADLMLVAGIRIEIRGLWSAGVTR